MKSYKVFLFFITVAVFLKGCSTTAQKPPQDIAKATPKQITELRATMMKATTMRSTKAPPSFPQQRRWSPRRHFGPLHANSPDIHLLGQTASFVYNRYFTGHPDAAVFQKYYGSPLPSNDPTLAQAIPGTVPGSDGFSEVRLGLVQLTYSARYGGSFKLTFRSLEDFQVEYRKTNDFWDIASLEMLVYVTPFPRFFNPNSPLSQLTTIYSVPVGAVHVEFRPRGVVGYTGSGLIVKDGDPLPTLLIALAESAQAIVRGVAGSAFRWHAACFSYGLVHAAFWEEIGQTNNVTAIEISDDFFFPRTSAGRPVAVVSVQISDVRLDTEPGGEEIYITLGASHMFQDASIPPTFSWDFAEIDNRGSTGWKTVGVFPLDWDCGQLETVLLILSVLEDDVGAFDDRYTTDPRMFETGPLDCSGMGTAFNNGQFGLYENLPDKLLLIVQDGEAEGALTARIRISVIKL